MAKKDTDGGENLSRKYARGDKMAVAMICRYTMNTRKLIPCSKAILLRMFEPP